MWLSNHHNHLSPIFRAKTYLAWSIQSNCQTYSTSAGQRVFAIDGPSRHSARTLPLVRIGPYSLEFSFPSLYRQFLAFWPVCTAPLGRLRVCYCSCILGVHSFSSILVSGGTGPGVLTIWCNIPWDFLCLFCVPHLYGMMSVSFASS